MSGTVDPARASYVKGIEAKTGKPLGELLELVDSWGPGKHGELLSKAKETLGLGHGHANLLVHLARERAEAADSGAANTESDPLDSIYVSSKEPLRPLHVALMARLDKDLGPFEIAPKKAYVSLRRSKQFAMVGPGSRGRLEVGINHRTAEGSARFEPLGPGKMCSHRVFVTTPDDIDEELVAFVRAAYEASA